MRGPADGAIVRLPVSGRWIGVAAASLAHAPLAQPADDRALGYGEFDCDHVPAAFEEAVKRNRLFDGAGESVEHEARLCVRLAESRGDNVGHHRVVDQFSAFHDHFDGAANRGAGLRRLTQHVPGRDRRNAKELS
jgi:hypothetical protein